LALERQLHLNPLAGSKRLRVRVVRRRPEPDLDKPHIPQLLNLPQLNGRISVFICVHLWFALSGPDRHRHGHGHSIVPVHRPGSEAHPRPAGLRNADPHHLHRQVRLTRRGKIIRIRKGDFGLPMPPSSRP